MSQSSFAGRFRVGTRIYAGFLVVLLLLAFLAVVGVTGVQSGITAFMVYAEVGGNALNVLGIDRNFTGMRRNIYLAFENNDEKAVARIKELRTLLATDLQESLQITRDPGRKANLERMQALLGQYNVQADKMIAERIREEKMLNEVLTPIGQETRQKMSDVMHAAIQAGNYQAGAFAGVAMEDIMRLRVEVLRFMVERDPKGIDKFKELVLNARASAAALVAELTVPEQRQAAQQATANVEKYNTAFLETAALTLANHKLVNETMAELAREFADLAAKTVSSQETAMKGLLNETTADLTATENFNIGIAVVAALFGLVAAWTIARTITGPVGRMTGAMGELAGGNLQAEIPSLGDLDEIGNMAKAVQVFKDNAIEKKRMDEAEAQRLEDERQRERAQREREKAIGLEIAALIDGVSHGDLSRRIDLADKDGFYRTLSEGINRLTDTVNGVVSDLAEVFGALASGDLSKRVAKDYQGAFARIKEDVNATSQKLAEIVGQITQASEAIAAAAGQVSAGSSDLSERTEQQASSLEETAASMEELSATVRSNADNAQRANQVAVDARGAAENGGAVAGSAIEAMKRIEGASRKIIDIIGVIDEIAFQTNLLALNAAVEAARAGDAGKGFAVVAQEVRVLAQRSAQASKEIKALILDSDAQVKDGVDLVKRAGETLGGIVSGVQQVASLIAEIAAASTEQATGLDEINATVASMDEMTQKNAALVEETTAAAQSMAGQASDLRHLMGFFKVDQHTAAQAAANTRVGGGGGGGAHPMAHHPPPAAAHGGAGHAPAGHAAAYKPVVHKPTAPAHKPVTRPAAQKPAAPAHHAPVAPTTGKPGALRRAQEAHGDDDWKEF